MIETLATITFLLAGFPLAAIVLRGAGAVFLSPIVSAVLAIFAGILHVLLDVAISLVWVVFVAFTLVLLAVPRLWKSFLSNAIEIRQSFEFGCLSIFLLLSATSSLSTPAPVGWDARSMWFAIPSWLNGPAEFYLTAQAGGAQTGWPEYPFFGPTSFATVWQMLGINEDLWLASRLSGILGLSLASLAAWLLLDRLGAEKQDWLRLAAFGLFVSAFFFVADGSLNNGYQDVAQGAAVAATLAASLWFTPESRARSFALIAVVSVAASNIKQEGFWFTMGVLLLAALYWALKRQFSFLVTLIPVVLARVIWSAFGAVVGMPESGSTRGMGERIPELFDSNSEAWSVIGTIMGGWFPQFHLGYFATVIAIFGVFLVSRKSHQGNLALGALIAATPIGIYLVILLTYAIGDSRSAIDWWLGTSYTRITASVVALTFLATLVAVVRFGPEAKKQTPKATGLKKRK